MATVTFVLLVVRLLLNSVLVISFAIIVLQVDCR
jgi:hypothetical protein